MSLGKTVKIVTGKTTSLMPRVGLGTWKSDVGAVRAAVASSLAVGYRHIDAAWIYGNEKEVGEGIKDSKVPRSEIFLTSKLWNDFHAPHDVEKTLDETLLRLGTTYLDLYLMHWPVAFSVPPSKANKYKPTIDWELTNDVSKTWKALEGLVRSGKVKHIGVSNFTIGRIQTLLTQCTIRPVVNQVELNLRCAQPDLVAWARLNNIVLQAYSPLGSTGAPQLTDEVVQAIAKDHNNCDPASVLIAFQTARGLVCLPKSVTPSRIKSNFQEIELSMVELVRLEKRAAELPTVRTVDPSKAWGVDIYNERPAAKL